MDSFIYSINATVPIFLVMIIGWFIKQIGLIDDHFANVANRYVFKVALPALLFRDLSKSDFKGKFDPQFVLYCSIVTILMFSLVWIATEILMKDDTQKGAFVQGSCRSSAAILGMAFVQNMYSDTGMAPLMIVAAVPLFNIFAVVVLTFKAHPADSSEAVKAGRGNNIKKEFKYNKIFNEYFINAFKIVGVEPVGIIVEMNGSINEYEHVDEIKPNLEFIIKNPKYFKPQIKVNTSLVSLKEFEKLNYQMSEIFDDIEYYDENDADISYSAEDMIKKLSGSN